MVQAVKDAAAAADKPPAPAEGEEAPKNKSRLPKSVLGLLKQLGMKAAKHGCPNTQAPRPQARRRCPEALHQHTWPSGTLTYALACSLPDLGMLAQAGGRRAHWLPDALCPEGEHQ